MHILIYILSHFMCFSPVCQLIRKAAAPPAPPAPPAPMSYLLSEVIAEFHELNWMWPTLRQFRHQDGANELNELYG